MAVVKFTLSYIDRELIQAHPKPPEPEDPGSNPGGPADPLLIYLKSTILTPNGSRSCGEGVNS
jgi:hypothetical protein